MRPPIRIAQAEAAAGGARLRRAVLAAMRAQLAGRPDLGPAARQEVARRVAEAVAARMPPPGRRR